MATQVACPANCRQTGSWPETLVLYRRRAFRRRCAWGRYSGAASIKPFERSRPWLRRARALWRLDEVEERCEGGWDLRDGAQLTAWKEKSSWERQVCGEWVTVRSEKKRFIGREDAEGLQVLRHPKHS